MGESKPTGILILAILYGLGGLGWLGFGGIAGAVLDVGGSILLGVGLVIAIVYFIIAWGLWTLQSWARLIAIIFAVIGLVGFPIGTIISIIILWYLFKPEIKEAFV